MSVLSQTSRQYLVALTAFALPTAGLLTLRLLAPATTSADAEVDMNQIDTTETPAAPGFVMLESDRALLRVFEESEVQATQRLGIGLGARTVQDGSQGSTLRGTDLSTGVAVTSVMKTSAGTVAAIQGRLYRVGDRLNPEWSVASIDDGALSVTLVHQNGQTMTLTIDTKRK